MGSKARDMMDTHYHTLSPRDTIAEAVDLFRRASRQEGKRIFGMMVTNDDGHLLGMLSMYDILLFMRPKHVHIWGEMEGIQLEGLLDAGLKKARTIQVGDIMSTDLVTVHPDTHLMLVLDIMIKKHVRRIPVVENQRIAGMVYISDVFTSFFQDLSQNDSGPMLGLPRHGDPLPHPDT